MKTTIDIDDELFRAAKIHAVEARTSLRDVVEAALRKFLHTQPDGVRRPAQIAMILAEMDALPVLDARTPEEILGYDEHGTFE